MADYILRYARKEDTEQLIRIWHSSFGDGEDFIREMLLGCGLLDCAVGAETDGELRSCMFAFDGIEAAGVKCSYLYALGTQPEYRGMGLGRAVTSYAGEMAIARGADAAFLRPADGELEKWYAETLGAEAFGRGDFQPLGFEAAPREKASPISHGEYSRLRGESMWKIPPRLLKAQETVNRYFGGAFLAFGGNTLCAEKCERGIFIRESFGGENSAAAAASEFFGAKEVYALKGCADGRCLMLLKKGKHEIFPLDISPLPFTLD